MAVLLREWKPRVGLFQISTHIGLVKQQEIFEWKQSSTDHFTVACLVDCALNESAGDFAFTDNKADTSTISHDQSKKWRANTETAT